MLEGDTVLLSLVIPARNEAANVAALFSRLDGALAGLSVEYILVDDSDDGTEDIARETPTTAPLRVIHRPARARDGGLGGALLAGFRAARGEWVAVLDADLQHPPEAALALLRAGIEQNAELVIGSRYVKGGCAAGLGGPVRRVISRLSTALSRLLLYPRLEGVADSGSGFYLVKREAIPLERYRPTGFKSLMELLVRRKWQGVVEVAYRFEERQRGETKAGPREGARFAKHLAQLFWSEPAAGRIWKFLLIGIAGAGVNLIFFWLALFGGLPLVGAWAISVEASILTNWWMHCRITFPDRLRHDGSRLASLRLLGYHASTVSGIALNGLIFFGLTSLGITSHVLALLFAIGGASAVNFFIADRVAFRGRPNPGAATTTLERKEAIT